MEIKKTNLPREVRLGIEKKLDDLGFFPCNYVYPETVIITTEHCPLCGKNLNLRCEGNSYEVICPMHGMIAGARGI